jgi:hypothetical protein
MKLRIRSQKSEVLDNRVYIYSLLTYDS